MMFIDSHSHIYAEEFDGDLPEVILRAKKVGVGKKDYPYQILILVQYNECLMFVMITKVFAIPLLDCTQLR